MNLFQSIILGIVQGLSEFIPISSSAHLVIVPYLLGWNIPHDQSFVFDVLVQAATLVGVFSYFWNDVVKITRAILLGIWHRQPFADPQARLGWYLFLASIPAGLVGLAIKDTIEAAFHNTIATALFLLVTAILLIIAERIGKRNRPFDRITWKDAIIIGFFQAIALFPGVSRSGSTIAGAMTRDLERPAAARFSFLMSIPIMFAAGMVALIDLFKIPNVEHSLPIFLPGFIVAGVVGYLSIKWLLFFLSRYSLYYFAAYCVVISMITISTSMLIR